MASTERFILFGNIARFLDRISEEESVEDKARLSKILRDEGDKCLRIAARPDGFDDQIARVDGLVSHLQSKFEGRIMNEATASLFAVTIENLLHVRANLIKARNGADVKRDKLQHP